MKTRVEVGRLLGLTVGEIVALETKLASDLPAFQALTTRVNRIYAYGRAVDDAGHPINAPAPEEKPT